MSQNQNFGHIYVKVTHHGLWGPRKTLAYLLIVHLRKGGDFTWSPVREQPVEAQFLPWHRCLALSMLSQR